MKENMWMTGADLLFGLSFKIYANRVNWQYNLILFIYPSLLLLLQMNERCKMRRRRWRRRMRGSSREMRRRKRNAKIDVGKNISMKFERKRRWKTTRILILEFHVERKWDWCNKRRGMKSREELQWKKYGKTETIWGS